jgi:aspartate oxidase
MTAVARWCAASALARKESRGMHHRIDAPERDPGLSQRQRTGGLSAVWTGFEPAALELAGVR